MGISIMASGLLLPHSLSTYAVRLANSPPTICNSSEIMESYIPGNLSQLQCFHNLTEQQINQSLHWFNINCTHDLCTEEWRSLNLVRSVLAFLGSLMVLAILVFLIYYKAYSSLFQRLYLYLIIATLLNELVGVVSIEHQWHYPRQETVCVCVDWIVHWMDIRTAVHFLL